MIKALDEFGTPDINLSVDDIINPDIVVQFGKPPLRINILAAIDGVDFDTAFNNRFIHDLGSLKK